MPQPNFEDILTAQLPGVMDFRNITPKLFRNPKLRPIDSSPAHYPRGSASVWRAFYLSSTAICILHLLVPSQRIELFIQKLGVLHGLFYTFHLLHKTDVQGTPYSSTVIALLPLPYVF
ncbi:hypothetical protein CU097_004297 [Rhizopus azygosporus]|uniref:Uncharacterized protein n=1 Tax=Rhizopus azygosporus TaxID=86630 RepID=A0A367IRJ4_RHIAZ|nr:hypothetical protein CU097_004297 [Rhizopus azygosporus]